MRRLWRFTCGQWISLGQLRKSLRKEDEFLTGAMCVVLWIGIGAVLYQERDFALLNARHDTANIARAFEENTKRTVGVIDHTLLFLRSAYYDPDHFDLAGWQRDHLGMDELTFQLAIIDAAGQLRASSLGPVQAAVDLSDREHFRAQLTGKRDSLFISKPVQGRESGKWSIQFTRKILGRDGSFQGVGVVSLDPFALSKFYASIDVGKGSVLLVGQDGIVRAGAPLNAKLLGRDIGGSAFFAATRMEAAGTLKSTGVSGTPEIMSFRRLDQYGLVVAVGVDREEVFASYNRDRMGYLLGGAVFTIIILLASRVVVRSRRLLLRTQATLVKSQKDLTDTLENMSEGIFMVDAEGKIAVINNRAVELLGIPDHLSRVGTSFGDLRKWQIAIDGVDYDQSETLPENSGDFEPLNTFYECTRLNGMTLEVQMHRLSDKGAVRTFTDITDRKRAKAQVVYLAHHDALTGLANRRFFYDRLAHSIALAERKEAGFALLCLDLDRFKQVNDTRGHDVGDRLLRMAADRLRANVRESDIVARFGGDEFAVLQMDVEQPFAAADLGKRLVACLAEPYSIGDAQLTIGMSAGIALHPENGQTAAHLLKSADIALYEAKEGGRGQVCFFEPEMDRAVRERYALEHDLREAIALDRIDVAFQPICDVASGRLLAYETLARWTCVERGPISPKVFIPVAEEIGLIWTLSRSILRMACRAAAKWPHHVRVTVNLSPLQFLEPDFHEYIRDILSETGLEPGRLSLEVAESTLTHNSEQTLATMHLLRDQGINFYLDDFGTDHAGLSYLVRFPFDCIKISRVFTERFVSDRAAEAVIRVAVFLGDFLQIDVLAKGVETPTQRDLLQSLGCRQVQGFLLDQPRPSHDIPESRFWSGYGHERETASRAS